MIFLSNGSRHLIEWGGSETGGLITQTIGNNQLAVVEESATGINRYFHFSSQPSQRIHPSRGSSALFVRCLGPAARDRAGAAATSVPKPLTAAFPSSFVRHLSVPGGSRSISRLPQPRLSRRNGQPGYPLAHPAKQPSRHMTLRQEQPIIAGMFFTCRPPVFTSRCWRLVKDQFPILCGKISRRHRFPKFVGDHAQPKPHLVGPEPMATQPCHLHRLLAFFDHCSAVPLLL